MPYSKGHVCLCVFPRDGQGWEGHSGQGSKENSSLMTDQMKAKKKRRRGITCSVIMIMGKKTLGVSSVKAFVQRNVRVKDVLIL